MSKKEGLDLLKTACDKGALDNLAEEYVVFCHTSEEKTEEKEHEGTSKKRKACEPPSKFPNVAGFCRYFGIGHREYDRLSKKYPEEFEKLSAILEDEALNSEISASVLTAYLKKRLGYAETEKEEKSEVETGQIRLVFDHDILSDGM